MKRSTLLYLASSLIFVLFVFTVLSSNKTNQPNGPSTNSATVADPNTVLINKFMFGPSKLTVKKGTTITWTNKDSAHHDITPTNGASDFKGSEKLLSKNESYSFTFNNVGVYNYKCSPHPFMKGTVEVTE